MDDFAKFLGMDGLDVDMFYESYYQLNVDDEYEEDEYREETHYQTY